VAELELPSGSSGEEASGCMRAIYDAVVRELEGECASHGIPIEMVAPAIKHRCDEIEEKEAKAVDAGRRMVGGGYTNDGGDTRSSRERALAAAERRRARDRCQEKNEER